MSIDALIDMTNRYGKNEEFVIGAGGNTSLKDGETLYVTRSGASLAEVSADGFVAMNIDKLRQELKRKYPAGMSDFDVEKKSFEAILEAREIGEDTKRPSVESMLHALLPYKYVIHLHPALINGLTCSNEYLTTGKKLFPQAVFAGIMPPGPGLARMCVAAINECSDKAALLRTGSRRPFEAPQSCLVHCITNKNSAFPQIVFLQNHGIIVSADSIGEIDDLMTSVIDRLTREITEMPDDTDFDIAAQPLTPEQVIYPNDEALLKNAAKIAAYAQSFGGTNPLPSEVVKSMKEFNPYG